MSEDQAVVEPDDVEPQAATDTADAQVKDTDDLDALLAQFDEPVAKPDPAPAGDKPSVSKDDLAEVIQFNRQMQAERLQADVDKAVDYIHENLDEGINIGKRALKSMLNGAAGEDERLRAAFMGRHERPDLYQKTLKALASEWSKEFQPIDKPATETREAVSNAVRSASRQAASEPEDFSKVGRMNDVEFDQWKREQSKKLKKG